MANRAYQETQINSTVEKVSDCRKVLVQLPTGGGKTYEFALIAQRYCRNTNKSVLILVHRHELMEQAARTIRKVANIEPYLINSDTKRLGISRVYIGMVESTYARTHMFDNVGLVIIDECHMANFNKAHEWFLEELIIGFSATPISSSKKEPLNRFYKAIITGPQIKELIENKFLAQNITRCPKDVVDSTLLEIDKLKGDFNENKMASEYKKPKNIANVVKSYQRFCNDKKTIVFNVTIEHSKEVNAAFVMCGYNARHLDSKNGSDRSNVINPTTGRFFSDLREEIFYWFKVTPDAILNSVMIPTVGFDEPTVQNIILNFSTLSLVKFIQTAGRGGRIIDFEFINSYQKDYPYDLDLKEDFNIIDLGGNCVRFGDWSDDRDWEYIFNNPERSGDGVAPVKTCPSCEGLVHAAVTVCPLRNENGELCLHEFVKRKTAEEQDLEEMILITKGIDPDKMAMQNRLKYEYYTFLEMAVPVVHNMYANYKEPSEDIVNKHFAAYYELCKKWYLEWMVCKCLYICRCGKSSRLKNIDTDAWHLRRASGNFYGLVKTLKPKVVEFKPKEINA